MSNTVKVQFQSWQEWPGRPEKSFPMFNVFGMPGIPKDTATTVALKTLEDKQLPVPDYPALTEWKAGRP